MPLTVVTAMWVEARAVAPSLPGHPPIRVGMGARAAAGVPRGGALAVLGLCGGLAPSVEPGDVVVATEVRWPAVACFRALEVADALRARGFTVHAGPVLTTRRPLVGRRARAAAARAGAIAVDMESAPLAAAHRRHGGGPLLVLRVAVDTTRLALFSPRIVPAGVRALRTLRRAAPAVLEWTGATQP